MDAIEYPGGQDLCGGVFQSFDLIETTMIQGFQHGSKDPTYLSIVLYPAEFGIQGTFQTKNHSVGVSVQTVASVSLRNMGEPVCRIEGKGFGNAVGHEPSLFVLNSIPTIILLQNKPMARLDATIDRYLRKKAKGCILNADQVDAWDFPDSGSAREDGFDPQQAGMVLTKKSKELQEIRQSLDSLQSRVQELSGPNQVPESSPVATAVAELPPAGEPASASEHFSEPLISLQTQPGVNQMHRCLDELTGFTKLKDFPEFFGRLADETGLRLVLLKRWTSGLQVFMERNIKLPADAKRKGRDGRAPIPCSKGDIFQAVGDEASVYCGPVPIKHFPLDLTLMLGRGSTEREIVILPLPSQNHWNTFLYMDADKASESALAIAQVLAHFALARMCLLNKGVRSHSGRVKAIYMSEVARREKSRKNRHLADPSPGKTTGQPRLENLAQEPIIDKDEGSDPLCFVTPPKVGPVDEKYLAELDPFEVSEDLGKAGKQPPTIPLSPAEIPVPGLDKNDFEGDPELPRKQTLTPELILSHSGELPALPKAACHIMAVIEDPKTTATRLEKALAMDQTLTAKVLRIANSPFYGAVREIRTVSEAIVRLGFVTIRNWTVVTATKSVFLAPGAGALYQKIWRQSVLSAMAGQLVGQALGTREPEGLFIGGLMQNIGQLVLARSHPQLFQEILTKSETSGSPYHEVEKKLLGFDHGALGAMLIRDWNLSEDLEQAVRWHHAFEDDKAEQASLAAMIALGEEIAACSGSGQSQDNPEDFPMDNTSENSMDDSLDDTQDSPVLVPLSPACRFLGVTQSQLKDLEAQAAQLRIDPHFFN